MGAPRNETVTRLTDNVVDKVASHLGNDGVSLGDDFVTRLDQVLGLPLEVTPNSPATTSLNVGAGAYTLPDGQRAAFYDDGNLSSQLAAGVINFALGTISTGTNGTFTRPTLTAGQFVLALIQYSAAANAVQVTFGPGSVSLGAAYAGTAPPLQEGYVAVMLVEMHSTGGGVGVFDAISKSAMVKLLDTSAPSIVSFSHEVQTVVTTPKTVFNLTTITIPKDRNKLSVFINGLRQDGHYTVNTDTQVTMDASVPVNAEVDFRIG